MDTANLYAGSCCILWIINDELRLVLKEQLAEMTELKFTTTVIASDPHCRARLSLNACDHDRDVEIFNIRMSAADVSDFALWVSSNWEAVQAESPPEFLPPGESIAERVALFLRTLPDDTIDVDPPELDHRMDALFEYRQRHSLRHALRGYSLKDIFVGLHRGAHELSFVSDGLAVRLPIDLCVLAEAASKLSSFVKQ